MRGVKHMGGGVNEGDQGDQVRVKYREGGPLRVLRYRMSWLVRA